MKNSEEENIHYKKDLKILFGKRGTIQVKTLIIAPFTNAV